LAASGGSQDWDAAKGTSPAALAPVAPPPNPNGCATRCGGGAIGAARVVKPMSATASLAGCREEEEKEGGGGGGVPAELRAADLRVPALVIFP